MLGTGDAAPKGALPPDQLETKLSRDDIYRQRVFGNDSGWNSFIERQDTRRLSEAELLLYVIFMMLCVWYSFDRIHVDETFEVNSSLRRAITEPLYKSRPFQKNWNNVVSDDDMRDWILEGLPYIVTPTIGQFNVPFTPLRFTWRRPLTKESDVSRFKAYFPTHADLEGLMHVDYNAHDTVEDKTSYGAYRVWELDEDSTATVATHLTWHSIAALECSQGQTLDELAFTGVTEEEATDQCREWCEQLLAPKPCRCWVLTGQYRCTFYHVAEQDLLRFEQWSDESGSSTQYQFIDQPEYDRVPPLERNTGVVSTWPTMRMFVHNSSQRGYKGNPGYVLTWPIWQDSVWYGDNGGEPVETTQENMIRQQIDDWLVGDWMVNNSLSTLVIDLLTVNADYNMYSWVQIIFTSLKSANVQARIEVDSLKIDETDYGFFTDLGVVGVLYFIMVVGLTLLELFQMLQRTIPKYFAVWWNWVTMISLILHFSTMLLYMRYRLESLTFSENLTTVYARANGDTNVLTDVNWQTELFLSFEEQVEAYQVWLNVSAYNLLFLFLQLVHYLNDIFPSVRVLIETMTHSISPIFFLVVLITDILLGFVFASNLIFGPQLEMFADFPSAFTSCLELLFGKFEIFHHMRRVRLVAGTVFFFFYMLIFKYIMENFARAIIILAYEDAATRFQDSKELKKSRQVVGENRGGNAFLGTVLKWIRRTLQRWSTDIKQSSAATEARGKGIYQAAASSCLFSVFIICYVMMIYLIVGPALSHEMQRVASYNIEKATYDKARESGSVFEGMNFSSIVDADDVQQWMAQALPQVVFPSQRSFDGGVNPFTLYESALPEVYQQAVMSNYNIFLGQNPVRLTTRWFRMEQASSSAELNAAMSLIGVNGTNEYVRYPATSTDKHPVRFGARAEPSDEAEFQEATNISEIVSPRAQAFLLQHCNYSTSAYGSTSWDARGGWVCMLPVDEEAATEALEAIAEESIIHHQLGTLAIDFVLFNGYSEAFAYVSIVFNLQPSGHIDKHISVEATRLEYPGAAEIMIWFFAILIMALNLFYLGSTLASLRNVCVSVVNNTRKREVELGGPSGDLKFVDKCILAVRTSVLFFMFDPFNLMDLISSILTISGMVIWFELYSSPLRTSYYFSERPEWNTGTCNSEGLTWCSDQEVLALFFEMAVNLRHFIRIQGINIGLIFFRFLKYTRSFGRVELLFKALRGGIHDVGVFVIVFFTILTGYVLAGLQLFGSDIEGFRNAGQAYRQCFDMFLGTFDYREMRETSDFNARLYFFSFMILFKYIIVNMFTAIVHLSFYRANKEYELEQRPRSVSGASATGDSMSSGFMRQAFSRLRHKMMSDKRGGTDSSNAKDYAGAADASAAMADDGANGHENGAANGHKNGNGHNGQNGYGGNGHNGSHSGHTLTYGDASDAIELMDGDGRGDDSGEHDRWKNGYLTEITEDDIPKDKKWHWLPETMKKWAIETSNEILLELDQLEQTRSTAEQTAERAELDRCLEDAESKYAEKLKATQKSANDVKLELEREELHGLKVVHQDQESLAWYIMKKEVEHQRLRDEMKHKEQRLQKMKDATLSLIDSGGEPGSLQDGND